MTLTDLVPTAPTFHRYDDMFWELRRACEEHPDAAFVEIGQSEEDRPLAGLVLGDGSQKVSLIAGNHADEPVGPETLRRLVLGLLSEEALAPLLEQYRFVIVPHTNPDGAARNQAWRAQWPDPVAYLTEAVREVPGRDLEFGFPKMRPENEAVSTFLRQNAPYALHMSLHGMSISEGALLLIERHWGFRTEALQEGFRKAAADAALPMHDQNRKGEKGFFYLGPGFWTTPEGAAMRAFFHAQGDNAMAARFHDSSMEFVRGLGGDPLCLVTELPLFTIEPDPENPPGRPLAYQRLRAELPELKARAERGENIRPALERYALCPLPIRIGMRLQLRALELGLEAV